MIFPDEAQELATQDQMQEARLPKEICHYGWACEALRKVHYLQAVVGGVPGRPQKIHLTVDIGGTLERDW